MPTISWFYGISIRMFFNDHAPPHFHVVHEGAEAIVAIDTGEVLKGKLPPTATRLVREWDFGELAGETGPMVDPFKNPAFFDKVFLEFGALTWPNGFDWSPEALHADMLVAGALTFEVALA